MKVFTGALGHIGQSGRVLATPATRIWHPAFRDHAIRRHEFVITESWCANIGTRNSVITASGTSWALSTDLGARQLADVQLAGWSASARATIPAPLPKRQHDLGGHDAGPAGHVREG